MTRKYCCTLFLALCLTGSVLKLRVTWQPSTLPVKPTAMAWIIDSTKNRKDFMPSEEGFIEFKKRVKRNSGETNSQLISDESAHSGFYNLEETSGISSGILKAPERDFASGSGTLVESSGDYYSGSGDEGLKLANPNYNVSYETNRDFNEISGSGYISLPENNNNGSTFEDGSAMILKDYHTPEMESVKPSVSSETNTESSKMESITWKQKQFETTINTESSRIETTTIPTVIFNSSEAPITSTTTAEPSSSQPTEEPTNQIEDDVSSSTKAFTVKSEFQEDHTHSGNDAITEVAAAAGLPCTSSSQCDKDRNQRCVKKGEISVCDCGRSFLLNPVTNRCEVKFSLFGRLRCPKERYHPELINRDSLEYQRTEKEAKEALLLIFDNCNCMNLPGTHLLVIALHSGSLVIDWQLTFPFSMHGVQKQFITSLHKSIELSLQNQQLSKSPVDLRGAQLVYVNANDPCSDPELNYCSPNALCKGFNDTVGGFTCVCNKEYQDISPNNKLYPGEICQEICVKGYCSKNGECSVVNNKPICRCDDWYSGKRCEVSALVLSASFGSIFVLVLAIAISFGKYYYKKRKGSCGTFKLDTISNSRVYEQIALSQINMWNRCEI